MVLNSDVYICSICGNFGDALREAAFKKFQALQYLLQELSELSEFILIYGRFFTFFT